MTLCRHVMATAAARRASDDDLWVCCASRMAHTTDIRVSRPHRAERPQVHPPSCGSEFVRRFGGHRIGARRRRVDPRVNRAGAAALAANPILRADATHRGISRTPRPQSRGARAQIVNNVQCTRTKPRIASVRALPHRESMRSRFGTAFFVWPASPAPSFRPQAPYSSSPRLRTRSSDRVNGAPGVVLKQAQSAARRHGELVSGDVGLPGW
jgi:hypothetical protein